ncbi:MAG: SirB2 family protein [Halioglobus sp.]|nr:SirB2 family protein [Halioglobus sp.]
MTSAAFLKLLHVSCALLSIAGFSLRGYWMATDNPALGHRVVKRLPHVIDTLLLLSAVGLLLVWQLSPLQTPWILAKLLALVVYIALGLVALRLGRTKRLRVGAYLLALITAGYIVSVAYSKSPLGFMQ